LGKPLQSQTIDMLYQKIEKTATGRRFVIADVHGCAKTFWYLVKEQINLQINDQLFLLGDYINRGPDNAGVIDFILNLRQENYQVFALRGNHEQMLLDSQQDLRETLKAKRMVRLHKRKDLVDETGFLLEKYVNFFRGLPYYFELDNFYLVHAGFNLYVDDFLQDYNDMLWIRDFKEKAQRDNKTFWGKKVIIGHTKYWMEDIKKAIEEEETIIPLDNGCYTALYHSFSPYLGSLCALNLDTMELITQPCIDEPNQ